MFNWLFGKNDWKLVWHEQASWDLVRRNQFGSITEEWKEPSYYAIYYSPSRDKYKLRTSGYNPQRHPYYDSAMKALARYENGQVKKVLESQFL
jgi:hypothetical protein